MRHLTLRTFDEYVGTADFAVINFHAAWCQPCKQMDPILSKLDDKKVISVFKVDVDQETELAVLYGIRSIPTFIFTKDGDVIDTITGALTETQLQSWLEKNI